MHADIELLATLRLLLLAHVALVLVVDKVDDRGPRVSVVDIVAETRSVDDGELDAELLLFELGLDDIDLERKKKSLEKRLLGALAKTSALTSVVLSNCLRWRRL
jgi:hypothetical protein